VSVALRTQGMMDRFSRWIDFIEKPIACSRA